MSDGTPHTPGKTADSMVHLSVPEFRTLIHDLRGPLAAIVMNGGELVVSKDLGPLDREVLDDILGSAKEMLQLLTEISENVLSRGR